MEEKDTDFLENSSHRIKFDTGELSTALIPPDFTEPKVLFDVLIKTMGNYHPSADLEIVRRAYDVADKAHEGQKRKSGEPYIIHPICVGIILAQLELDKETIVAGLLHDVIEDTAYTSEEIVEMFGEEVALLVDGVTKLTQLSYSADKIEVQAENLRKMFLAMAKDIRVIVIKLADRLHNMRTLQYKKPEKQKETARETMDIYAPLAHRLGISKLKVELDDLSLRYLHPEVYKELTESLGFMRGERENFINEIISDVRKEIEAAGIVAKIDGRVKHRFSIYRKMLNQNKTLDQIYDLFAIRIIVEDMEQCYTVLGLIHKIYTPIPGRFKDYISMPKPNRYQSLHTTLIGSAGQPFEIQIRTYEMHRTAEYGIAAHWKYKERGGSVSADSEEEKMSWLRQILEWQHEMSDNKEFMDVLKSDLDLSFDSVYCFTPNGDVKTLPAGSTPIDFAYSIHSAVGNKMVGAKANGNLVSIDYEIQNGDRVEILTSHNSKGPSRDWLSIVQSTQAKNKIHQWFNVQLKEENIIRGKEMLQNYCKARNIKLSDLLKRKYMQACMRKYGFRDWDSVYAALGHGGVKEGQIINRLQVECEKLNRRIISDEQVLEVIDSAKGNKSQTEVIRRVKEKSGILVKGVDDLSIRFSKCCNPVPGDEIVGFVTRGRGVSIHRTDCVNILHLPDAERNRLIASEWTKQAVKQKKEVYLVEIVIFSHNRSGVLFDISKVFNENNIDVKSMEIRVSKNNKATISVGFETHGVDQLNLIVNKIQAVESIIDIKRKTNG